MSKRSPRLVYKHTMVPTKRLLPLSSSRVIGLLKSSSPILTLASGSSQNVLLLVALYLLLLCSCFAIALLIVLALLIDFEALFPICVTESRTVSFIGTSTSLQGSLFGQTTGKMFRCFSKSQPVLIHGWPKQTDLHTLSRQSYSESNSVFRLPSDQTGVASCSLSLGVLIVSVFIIGPERKFESLTSSVLPSRSLRLWI